MDWNEPSIPHDLRPDTSALPGRRLGDSRLSLATSSRSSNSSYGRNGYGHDPEHRISHESKPRLSKEQQDILERHFQAQPKPTTITKKGFSDNLGVPLDKINNWFQNRRAKVKQDAKKQQEASMGAHNIFDSNFMANNGQPSNDSSFIDSTFYQTVNTTIDPNSLPMPTGPFLPGNHNKSLRQNRGDRAVQKGESQNASQTGPLEQSRMGPPMSEPTFDDSPDVFNQFFGLDDNSTHGMNNYVDHDALWAFSKQFNPSWDVYGNNFSPQTNEGFGGSFANHNEPNFSQHTRAGPPNVTTTVSPDPPQVQQHLPQGTGMNYPHLTINSVLANQLSMQNQNEYSDMDLEQDNLEGLTRLQPSSEQSEQSRKSSAVKSEDSKTDPSSGQEDGPIKSPAPTTSGLASRRQKRPAALGTAALRTVSHNSSLQSPSKTAIPAPPASDATIRRIKSSGVLTGRVQKSGTSSAPRSPRNFSFAEGIASPKASRKVSTTSLNAAADNSSSGANTVPLTPLSPREMSQLPYSKSNNASRMHITIPEHDVEHADSVWSNMPTTADSTYTSVWSYMPHTSDTIPSYASPPGSPMDPSQYAHINLQNPLMYNYAASVPQSAPAWQSNFIFSPSHYNPHAGFMYPPMPQYPSEPFRPYTSGEEHMGLVPPIFQEPIYQEPQSIHASSEPIPIPPRVPTSPGPLDTTSLQHSGQPTGQAMISQQEPNSAFSPPRAQTQSTVGSPIQELRSHHSKSPPQNASRSPSTARTKAPLNELFIHEYSPREPADPSRLPPKTKNAPPKEYIFTHHGPEHYSSP